MNPSKPLASLSLDLDDKWTYLKTHGEPSWESFPSYLGVVVPRVLDFLKARGLRITFFVVGLDAALEGNAGVLKAIADDGHEIGNHSFTHEPWLHLYSPAQAAREVLRAEEHIQRVTGKRPVGFRGPGFSMSGATLRLLARRGYLYDASTFPTFLTPLARAYYFLTASFDEEQKRLRRSMGGTFWAGFRPLRPYSWRLAEGPLLEIPVTTMPLFKVPIHASYVHTLALASRRLALRYFDLALRLCRWTGVQPSILLHPTDFIGCEDTRELAFFPGMSLPSERKVELVAEMIQRLTARFTVVPLEEHARALLRSRLRSRQPHFPEGGEDAPPADLLRRAG
jgi:hypothetical protein